MTKRILTVDDEPLVTRALRLCLESLGIYEVCEENDAYEALATAREFQPDLILMDVMMPFETGDEVALRIQNDPQLRGTPIVYLTSLAGDAEGDRNPTGARTRYLPKPFSARQLVECIAEHLDRPENSGSSCLRRERHRILATAS